MKKMCFILSVLFLLPNLLFSQSGKLRGIVTDKEWGNPLPGANVIVEDSQQGTVSEITGEYILLAMQPGVYSIQVEYTGYQTVTISNIRVSSNLITTLDFKLEPIKADIESLQLVAKRPIIQRNTTNTFHVFTQEDVQKLPIRGLENIIALNAGTVVQDGEFHIRGGRSREINYLVDGATATNPFSNELNTMIIQEAIEEIQMQTGGFTAEYGGSNSAIVNTTIRTGDSKIRGTIDYRTDDFAQGGNTFLGTTSRGYHNIVATIGGPVPFSPKMRFFLAGQYNYTRNRTSIFIEPFSFDPLNKKLPQWSQKLWDSGQREFYAPWFVEDGLSGRSDSRDDPLENADGKVVPFKFERNFLPNNDTRSFTTNGTLVYNMSNSIKFRLTGSYDYTRQPQGWENFSKAVTNYYSNTEDLNEWKRSFINLTMTHIINPSTFYEVGIHRSNEKFKNYDPRFGDEWWKYSDSREWGKAGLDTSEWQRTFIDPPSYSAVFDFTFTPPNEKKREYTKREQKNIGFSLDLTKQLNKNIEVKIGGRFDQWTDRYWNVRPESFLWFMYGGDLEYWPLGRQWEDQYDPNTGELLWSAEYLRTIDLDRRGGINYYGWDIMGENKANDGHYGPRKPLFVSAYLQTIFEFKNLIFNAGLRWEHHGYNVLRPEIPEMPIYNVINDIDGWDYEWIDADALIYTKPNNYFLPRLNVAFPITENTVIFAQYGKYIQSIGLDNIYQSFSSLSNLTPENRSEIYPSVYYLQKPERSTHYELGIRQSLSENFSVSATAFYKNMTDLVGAGFLYADGTVPKEIGGLPKGELFDAAYLNNTIANAKGLEINLQLNRIKRMAGRFNYALLNTNGTGSDRFSNTVVSSHAGIPQNGPARFPTYLYPLDYNQKHRGNVMLDYRFTKGDGGKLLEGIGLNVLFTFNSGHSYTKIQEAPILGSTTPWVIGIRTTLDSRFRKPTEPINSSTTPWNYNIDITFEKLFYFSSFNLKIYSTILNLLNTKNIINVYPSTGSDDDDGWLKQPLADSYKAIPGYEAFYRTLNLINGYSYQWTGNHLWGAPRQIRFGIMLEFK